MNKDLNYYMKLTYQVTIQTITETDGDSLEEGKAELHEAKKAWFTSCLRRKIAIPVN